MKKNNEITDMVKKYIYENIDENVSPTDTADAVNYSTRKLNRIFFLVTGLTLGEYIRWSKLAKAFFEVKHGGTPLIDICLKYGYETQGDFTRAFKDNFAVTPGDYRKTKQSITAKNWHVNEFIHQEAHNASSEGLFTRGHVEHWIVAKPERLWVSIRKNTENLPSYKFYNLCDKEGIIKKAEAFSNTVLVGGAYLPSKYNRLLSFGVEVETDYPPNLIGEYEVICILQSKFVVFNYPKYSIEKHGDAIRSTWGAQYNFDIKAKGLKWDVSNVPVFEIDNDEIGYALWFPARDAETQIHF